MNANAGGDGSVPAVTASAMRYGPSGPSYGAAPDVQVWSSRPGHRDTPGMRRRATVCTVAAAFADEREASYAVRLIGASPEIKARFTLRRVLNDRGDSSMVILEAHLADGGQVDRVETCMLDAHGAIIPSEVVAQASIAS
jgi:hypothetical protein